MRQKKTISLLLAAAMMLTLCACGGQTESGVTAESLSGGTGRYVETNITPESYASYAADADFNSCIALQYGDDDTVDLAVRFGVRDSAGNLASSDLIWYHSEDKGDTWEEQTLTDLWDRDLAQEWYFGTDGSVYSWTLVTDYDEDTDISKVTAVRLYKMADGEESVTDYDFCEPERTMGGWNPGGIYQDKYLLFIVSYEEGDTLYVMDITTGEFLWTVSADYYNLSFAVAGDTVYVSDRGQLNNSYNLSNGTLLDELDMTGMSENDCYLSSSRMTEQGSYYFLDSDLNFCMGILGSNLKEIILDGTYYRYGSQLNVLDSSMDFYVAEDNTIYINARSDEQELNLYRYDYDADATYGTTTLTVWALEDSATIRQAIYAFQESHPEVEVDLQVQDYGAYSESGRTLNDVLTTLNTQMLAGNGPDVLVLDGVDYENYIDKGVLEDLSDLVDGTEFVGETVSAFQQADGGYYVLPARFTVPLLLSSQADTPDSLDALAEAVAQEGADDPCLATTYYDLVWNLWYPSASALVTGDGVDTEALSAWLSALKTISDTYGYFAPEDEGTDSNFEEVIPGAYDYGNLNTYVEDDAYTWLEQDSPWGLTTLDAVEDLVMALSTCERYGKDISDFTVTQAPGLVEGAYAPKVLLGVSAGSNVTETAKEFVACVLSLEVQQYTYGDGLPVLQEAIDQQLDYFADPAAEYGWDIDELRVLLDSRTTPSTASELVLEAVYGAAEPYWSGELTLDDAIAQVEDDLALMLAEQ
ncbi:MAG: ABC transporter substrate-binding protein [Clostridiales bacterium]|nr:ABC transporter substrate-binding protein [Clostridiales bacterium]